MQFDSVGRHPFSYEDSDIKYPMNDVDSSTSNLLSLLFLTNTDTTWSFCGCDERRDIHSCACTTLTEYKVHSYI